MTASTSPEIGAIETLEFKKKPIRAIPVDGVLWYCLRDMNDAVGWPEIAVDRIPEGHVPAFAMIATESVANAAEDAEDDFAARTYLSPVGVLFWTCSVNDWEGQSITAWAKREARARCPILPAGDRALTLTIVESPDGRKHLPPKAMKYSGWKYDRDDLRVSDEWFKADRENHERLGNVAELIDFSMPFAPSRAA